MLLADTLPTIQTYGAFIGLAVAIVLIIFKIHPVYSLIIGAIVGGITGLIGYSSNVVVDTVNCMVNGAQGMVKTILRILTSGILAGALIKTGSAEKIAKSITKGLGPKFALAAIAISTMIICTVGVFIDIAIITVAPIAISLAKQTKHKTPTILLAMIGGGKAGNIISPNPNTLAVAEKFNVPLMGLIVRNIIPAILALGVTILIAYIMGRKKDTTLKEEKKSNKSKKKIEEEKLPNLILALLGPIVVVVILILRPTADVDIDPLIALPVGGLVTILVTRHYKETFSKMAFGLSKVVGIAVLLLGTGALAGIISNSGLKNDLTNMINALNMPVFLLAPFGGLFFAAATASTTSGATVASDVLAKTLIEHGVSPVGAGAMLHSSCTILDSLPHGSFFHATGGSVNMEFKDRLKLIPLEALVGLTSTIGSIIVFLIIK